MLPVVAEGRSLLEVEVKHAFEAQRVEFLKNFNVLEQHVLQRCVRSSERQFAKRQTPTLIDQIGEVDEDGNFETVRKSEDSLASSSSRTLAVSTSQRSVVSSGAAGSSSGAMATETKTPDSLIAEGQDRAAAHKRMFCSAISDINTPQRRTPQRRQQRELEAKNAFNQVTETHTNVINAFAELLKAKVAGSMGLSHSRQLMIRQCVDREYVPSCLKAPCKRFLENYIVSSVVIWLIVANAIIMAMEADVVIKNTIDAWQMGVSLNSTEATHSLIAKTPSWYTDVDWMFAASFTVELVCRLLVYEVQFFFGEDASWNSLDCFVVVFAWIELLGSQQAEDSQGGGMPPLRLFRLVRVIRSVRIIRSLRFFVELRLVMLSLAHSLKPLLWCTTCLAVIIFMFTNVFLQLLAVSLSVNQPDGSSDHWSEVLIPMFCSFGDAMTSLLGLATGGNDWDPFYRAFLASSQYAGLIFLVYMVLIVLGVLNVIGAVFVEGAMSKAKTDSHLALAGEQETRKEMANELIHVFHQIDAEGDGVIDYKDWEDFLATEAGRQFILLFNMEYPQAKKLFDILDFDDNEEILIEEFVMGFMQIQGSVNKMDLELSAEKSKKMMKMLKQHIVATDTMTLALFEKLEEIHNFMNEHPSTKMTKANATQRGVLPSFSSKDLPRPNVKTSRHVEYVLEPSTSNHTELQSRKVNNATCATQLPSDSNNGDALHGHVGFSL